MEMLVEVAQVLGVDAEVAFGVLRPERLRLHLTGVLEPDRDAAPDLCARIESEK